eukprot:6858246-Prymnesium_polylepis.1
MDQAKHFRASAAAFGRAENTNRATVGLLFRSVERSAGARADFMVLVTLRGGANLRVSWMPTSRQLDRHSGARRRGDAECRRPSGL